jgi:DNA topoisomerase-1
MAKTLIVIESPGKLKSYQKYLGSDYEIVASYGHVIDLPQSKKGKAKGKKGSGGLGVDIEDNFKPTYEVMEDKAAVVSSIVAKAKRADLTLLMTDPDREGEAISWHLSKQFPEGVQYKRAATASITKPAILAAIKNAGDINMRMVDSYETRRILDRLCGYKTSFLVKQATGGMSAGRVQSAALRILAEREKQIREFVPVEYWPVDAELLTADKKKVRAHVTDPDQMDTKNEKQALSVKGQIETGPVVVSAYDTKMVSNKTFPPYTTSKLQAGASNMFGWPQDKTMKVAQSLYEQGKITYMRTDSTHIEPGPMAQLRDQIVERYGKDCVTESQNYWKGGKNSQEAHEAIRPTNMEETVIGAGDEQKLYTLIWKRAVASQMNPEVREQVLATFTAGGKVVMKSGGSRQTFAGWKKCWDYRDATDTFLPPMKVGDRVDVIEVTYEQKHTEPPARYGVATFNSKLEELGIARPSTLATVTKTLQARDYIETKGNSHHVTDLGLRVTDFLVQSSFCFADLSFTRDMEDKLDDILNEKAEKLAVLTDFWQRLSGDIKRAGSKKADLNRTEYPCPECKKKGLEKFLVKKFSRFGPFFSCEARSDKDVKCEFTAIEGNEGQPVPKVKKQLEESEHHCDVCDQKLIVRHGQYGDFLGCRNWNKNEKCKGIWQMDGTRKPPSTGKKRFWGRKKKA